MSEFAIQIDNVTKTFGPNKALDQVSFEVQPQTIFGLLGPNGAGKTTLFSLAANFIHADSGSIRVLGIDVRNSSELRGRLGILPQDALFQRNVPIREQMVFFRRLADRSIPEAEQDVDEALEMVGLEEYRNRPIQHLSHGMIKRLGIAQAFMGNPEVILLDEPTAGLDPRNAHQVHEIIFRLRQSATIMVSSHNLAEIQSLCDHVAILKTGRLVSYGAVDEITSRDQRIELKLSRLLTEEELQDVLGINGIDNFELLDTTRYTASLDLIDRLGPREGEKIGGARLRQASDDILAELLASLVAQRCIPRYLREGNTLEAHFFKVTTDQQ